MVLYKRIYVDEYSLKRLMPFYAHEHGGWGALNSLFDEKLIVPLTSTEVERRLANDYARSIGSMFDTSRALLRMFELYPSLLRELDGMNTGFNGFFNDEIRYGFRNGRMIELEENGFPRMTSNVEEFLEHKMNFPFREYTVWMQRVDVLNTSAIRAWFALGLAMQKGIMYVPNEFRALFIPPDRIIKSSAAIIIKKLEKLFETKVEENAVWFEEPSSEMKLHFPPIFNYVMSKADKKKDILHIALEVRDSGPARRFREICETLDKARKEGDMRTVRSMTKEIDMQLQNISNLPDPKSTFNVTLSFPPSISFTIGSDIIDTIKKLRNQRNFIFLRNVFNGSRDPRRIMDFWIFDKNFKHYSDLA